MAHCRRKDTRVGANCAVWVRSYENVFRRARLVDLSNGGVALATDGGYWNRTVDVILRLKRGRYITVTAEPRWFADGVVGLKFRSPAEKLTTFLGTLVDSYVDRARMSLRCTALRARLSLDLTVPSGTSRMSATS